MLHHPHQAARIPGHEVSTMAKGNNAQGKDKKKAKAAPKKPKEAKKPAAPKK